MLAYPCIFWWWCVLIWSIAAWGEPLRASGASNGFSAWSIGPFGIPPVLPKAGQGGAAPWTFGRACVLMSAPWRAASSPLLVLPWAPGLSGGFWDFGDGHSYSCFPMTAVTRRSPPHPQGRRVFYTFPFLKVHCCHGVALGVASGRGIWSPGCKWPVGFVVCCRCVLPVPFLTLLAMPCLVSGWSVCLLP